MRGCASTATALREHCARIGAAGLGQARPTHQSVGPAPCEGVFLSVLAARAYACAVYCPGGQTTASAAAAAVAGLVNGLPFGGPFALRRWKIKA